MRNGLDGPSTEGLGLGPGLTLKAVGVPPFLCARHDQEDPSNKGYQRDPLEPATPIRVMEATRGDGETRKERNQREDRRGLITDYPQREHCD